MTTATPLAIDLFAGPGGWSEALATLDLPEQGYELDGAACATARAAGHARVQADVAAVDLTGLLTTLAADGYLVAGLIASPPCQAWSRAGKRKGILDQPRIFRFLAAVIEFAKTDPGTAYELARAQDEADNPEPWHDDRSRLVLEPVRWVLALNPRWVACEQVPDVLPFWELFAVLLRQLGYSVWTGLLSAERYGVPQTRLRAILAASLDREMSEPPATHFAYNRRQDNDQGSLFEVDLLDWVSMAEALGWGLPRRPSPTITAGGTGSGGGAEPVAHLARYTPDALRSNYGTNGNPADRGERDASQPAATVTSKVSRNQWVYRNGNQANAAERPVDAPAPTVMFSHRANDVRWVAQARDSGPAAEREPRSVDQPSYTIRAAGSGSHPSGTRWMCSAGQTAPDSAGQRPRPVEEPSATLTSGGNAVWLQSNQTSDTAAQQKATRSAAAPALTMTTNARLFNWVTERPATTVQGDPRIAEPGHRDREGGVSQFTGESVRVTVQEAAILQSFPPDYPWSGSRTKQYEQVGNAIPPLLALAVVGHITGSAWQHINRAAYRAGWAA